MKKMNSIVKKCKSLSRQLSKSSSKSRREEIEDDEHQETVYVGSTRKRYVINSKYLKHPVLNALIDKSKQEEEGGEVLNLVRCEVVLFDHLLWMLENGHPNLASDSLDELADLYVL